MTGYAQWVAAHMLFIACVLFRRWACGHSRCRAAAFTALAFLAVLVSQVRIFTKAGALDAEIVPHSALDYLLASVSSCEQWATWAADGILVLIFLWYGSCEPTPAGRPKAVRTPGHKLHRCLMIVITFTSTVAAARILCDGSANRCWRIGTCLGAVVSQTLAPLALLRAASCLLVTCWDIEQQRSRHLILRATGVVLAGAVLVHMQVTGGRSPRHNSWLEHATKTCSGTTALIFAAFHFQLVHVLVRQPRHIPRSHKFSHATRALVGMCTAAGCFCAVGIVLAERGPVVITALCACAFDRHRVRYDISRLNARVLRNWPHLLSLRYVAGTVMVSAVLCCATIALVMHPVCKFSYMMSPAVVAEACFAAFPDLSIDAQMAHGLLMCPAFAMHFVPQAYGLELMCCTEPWQQHGAEPHTCAGHSTLKGAFTAGAACSLSRKFACKHRHTLPCNFRSGKTSGEKFLYTEVGEGLTNQRMALISSMALAAVLNRTFVLGDLRTGNRLMGGERNFVFGTLYDVGALVRRLPPALRVCEARPIELPHGRHSSTFGPHLAMFGGTHSSIQGLETTRRYARRFDSARGRLLLRLDHNVWKELPGASGWSCDSVFCPQGAREYLMLDRALLFVPQIRQEAAAICEHLHTKYSGSRLSWLHLRIESDWGRVKFDRCPFNNAESIAHKLIGTVSNASAGAGVGTSCATMPPTVHDVLYIAGGKMDVAFRSQVSNTFRAVATARDFHRTQQFLHQASVSALQELNILAAAIDFHVGTLSDTHIACDCSTFSSEVVVLRNIGLASLPRSSWTWSGPAYPQSKGLRPFWCKPTDFPWGGIASGGVVWQTNTTGLKYFPADSK